MEINIAYGATAYQLEYVSISIASILKKANPDDKYNFYILYNRVDSINKRYFTRLKSIKNANYNYFPMCGNVFDSIKNQPEKQCAFFKIFLTDMLPILDKILYLDANVLALSDIAEIYKQDVSDYYMGAVVDREETVLRQFLPKTHNAPVINTSVLLMNLKKLRENNFSIKTFQHLHDTNFLSDKLSINNVCKDNILLLPIKYNVTVSNDTTSYDNHREEYESAISNPVLQNLEPKPWKTEFIDDNRISYWKQLRKELNTSQAVDLNTYSYSSTDETTIHIAYGASRNYLEYTSISIASILKNASNTDEYHFYIMCDELQEEDKEYFYRLNKIKQANYHFLKPDSELFADAKQNPRGKGALFRLCLAELTTHLDKILYLDVDTIIHSDIAELYRIDVSDYYLGAVIDKCEDEMRILLPFEDNEYFINSGMLLMNLKKFRNESIGTKLLSHLRQTNYYSDQFSINAVCKSNMLYLPLKFNIMITPEQFMDYHTSYHTQPSEYITASQNPVVHHIMHKPWQPEHSQLSTSTDWLRLKEELAHLDD